MSIDRPFSLMTRRDMLRQTSAGFGATALAGLFGTRAQAAFPQQFTARAKRVIFLFMNGGPSHVDTFDPKPALNKHAGQQPSGKLYQTPKTTGFMPSQARPAAKVTLCCSAIPTSK